SAEDDYALHYRVTVLFQDLYPRHADAYLLATDTYLRPGPGLQESSAFGTSFSAAEISISAAVKTAGAAPAGLFPIASQPSTNRLAFVLMAEVRPGGQS